MSCARRLAIPCAVSVVLGSAGTLAQTGIDAQENVFGATNINATTGNGRLTVGISRDGDVTVLSWPSPSYNDQLAYRSSNALDARSLPLFGALPGGGLFLGLAYDAGGSLAVTWLRDRTVWTIAQDYGAADGPNPHTTFRNDTLGVSVQVIDAVAPGSDAFVRVVRVERDPGAVVQQAWLLTYANLSPLPATSRVAELPVADWMKDGENDFAAAWHADRDAVVHFHPADQRVYRSLGDLAGSPAVDWGPVGAALQSDTIDAVTLDTLVDQLEDSYGSGAWLALSTAPAPDQHQVGFDATPWCDQADQLLANMTQLSDVFPSFKLPFESETIAALLCKQQGSEIVAEQGWLYPAADPFEDAQDGALSGADLAAGEVAEALRTPLPFDGDVAMASVLLGAGATLSEALQALDHATSAEEVVGNAEQAALDWIDGLRVPGMVGDRPHQVARRALLNLRVGTDGDSGAIVASIARQPPYALDWPRDGAFFNVLLDISGQNALVAQRTELYAGWQRTEPVLPTPFVDPPPPIDPTTGESATYPDDAWEMNYYADGLTGGTFRFEVDTTAFAVWAAVAHAGWADDPRAHLSAQWSTIARGAELLARWRDDTTGLQAPAQEDDSAAHSQTLHGAITVFGALDMAARAGRLLGKDDQASRWESRARELRAAIQDHFYDPEIDAFFMSESDRLPIQASGLVPTGPTAWLVWPFPLFDWADPQIARQLERDYGVIEPVLNLEGPGGLYFMKNTISIAVAGGEPFAETVASLPGVLADQATPDTDQFGEVMVVIDEGGDRRADQRVSTPHLWESSLYYLTAMAAEDPTALLAYDAVLPPSQVLYPSPAVDDGCDCGLAPGNGGLGAPSWLWFGLGCWVARRRLRVSAA